MKLKSRTLVGAAALTLLASACGARLSAAQRAALDQAGRGGTASQVTTTPAPRPATTVAGARTATATSSSVASTPATTAASAGASSGTSAGSAGSGSSGGSGSATAGTGNGGGAQGSGGTAPTTPACPAGAPSSDPGVSASEIDVGNVSTLTGPVPGLFLGASRGVQAFATYLDDNGGVCGRKLVVKAADDDLAFSQNATATQSLEGSVLAFVGSFSVADDGGAPVLQASGIPDVGEALGPQRFNLANNFSPQPQPVGWIEAPYVYFAQKYGPAVTQHMAYFLEDQPVAEAQGQGEVATLKALGYQFVYNETVEPTQTNFTSEVNVMSSKGVTGIIWQGDPAQYAYMAKNMRDAGYSVPFADWGPPAYDPLFLSSAGSAANGAVLEQSVAMYEGEDAAAVPEVATFDRYYEALYHTPPDLYATYGWLSGMLFVQALDIAGAPTRAGLLRALQGITSFTGNGLVADSDPGGKKPPVCYIVIDVTGGKFVRDAADPPSGFRCDPGASYHYGDT